MPDMLDGVLNPVEWAEWKIDARARMLANQHQLERNFLARQERAAKAELQLRTEEVQRNAKDSAEQYTATGKKLHKVEDQIRQLLQSKQHLTEEKAEQAAAATAAAEAEAEFFRSIGDKRGKGKSRAFPQGTGPQSQQPPRLADSHEFGSQPARTHPPGHGTQSPLRTGHTGYESTQAPTTDPQGFGANKVLTGPTGPSSQPLLSFAPQLSIARGWYVAANQQRPSYSQMAQGPPDLNLREGDEWFTDIPVCKLAHVTQHAFQDPYKTTVTKAGAALVTMLPPEEKQRTTLRQFLNHVVHAPTPDPALVKCVSTLRTTRWLRTPRRWLPPSGRRLVLPTGVNDVHFWCFSCSRQDDRRFPSRQPPQGEKGASERQQQLPRPQ